MPINSKDNEKESPIDLTQDLEVNPFEVVEEESSFLSGIKDIFAGESKTVSDYSFKKNEGEKPLITILGSGAIGGTIACILAQSGCRVNCISSSLEMKQFSSLGIFLESPIYDEISFIPETTPWIKEKPKALIVATRSNQLDVAITAININKVAGVPIINLSGGYKEFEKLRDSFGNSVSVGKASFFSYRNEINRIKHSGGRIKLRIANKFYAERQKLEEIAPIFRNAGIEIETSDYETDNLWENFIPYAAASIFCAACGEKLSQILRSSTYSNELFNLVEEMVKIARSEGFKGTIEASVNAVKSIPERFILPFVIDFERGQTGEIKSLALDIIKLAAKNNVPCPKLKINTTNIIKTIEKRQFPEGSEVDFEEIVPDDFDFNDDMYVLELSDEEFAIVMDEEIALGEKEIQTENEEDFELENFEKTLDSLKTEKEETIELESFEKELENSNFEEKAEEKKEEPLEAKKAWNFYNQIN
jgi:2-dehydropantoate 2-reductase